MIQNFFNILEAKPQTGVVATPSIAILGYTPEVAAKLTNETINITDKLFQYGVWTVSIVVGIATLYVLICKEIDRKKDRRANRTTKED